MDSRAIATIPMIMQTLMMSGMTFNPALVAAMTNGEAAEPDAPRRRGSVEGTRRPMKTTQTMYMKPTRMGTSVAA